MKTEKITDEEIEKVKISSLPTRPCSDAAHGGAGLSAREMKEAFDKFPLLLAERINSLLADIESAGEDSVAAKIPSGIAKGHTLAKMLSDIPSGAFASYLDVLGTPLTDTILSMKAEIAELKLMLTGGGNV